MLLYLALFIILNIPENEKEAGLSGVGVEQRKAVSPIAQLVRALH